MYHHIRYGRVPKLLRDLKAVRQQPNYKYTHSSDTSKANSGRIILGAFLALVHCNDAICGSLLLLSHQVEPRDGTLPPYGRQKVVVRFLPSLPPRLSGFKGEGCEQEPLPSVFKGQ